MIRYAISDRHSLLPGAPLAQQTEALAKQALRLAHVGVHYFQLREKDLAAEDLLALAKHVREALPKGTGLQLELNGNALALQMRLSDLIGLAHEATHGRLYLSAQLAPSQEELGRAGREFGTTSLTVGCHTVDEAMRFRLHASLLLFAPVFGKRVAGETLPGVGLRVLHNACLVAAPTPVLALGSVTWQNAPQCLEAGAAGVAGIRLFQ